MSDTEKLNNAADSGLLSHALLADWREYSGHADSSHPCENFKAGWYAAYFLSKGVTPTDDTIRSACRGWRRNLSANETSAGTAPEGEAGQHSKA